MEKQKHTLEPWQACQQTYEVAIFGDAGERVASSPTMEYAARIVACVNACTGIKNPAAIPAMVKALEGITDAFQYLADTNRLPQGYMDHVTRGSSVLDDARAALAALKGE